MFILQPKLNNMKQIVVILGVIYAGILQAQRPPHFVNVSTEAHFEYEFKGISDWTPAIDVRTMFKVDDLTLKDGQVKFEYRLGYRLLEVPTHFQLWLYPAKLGYNFLEKKVYHGYNLTLRVLDSHIIKSGFEVDFIDNQAIPAVYFSFTPIHSYKKGGK